MKPRMTLEDAAAEFRAAGCSIGKKALADGIEKGIFPFGSILNTGKTGRRHILILTADFRKWAKENLGGEENHVNVQG